ncbi:MAG: hypothetical protein BJ554DRAFT_3889 [Olpidium bornovanus]|uniref:Uncharacterized protein n=1 Tax=Olpidium bornovanus TaxID=278681 RepID=A0A8H8DFH6_9FUNG|nr:MAG: hypothetical protein BJ554DRAFT_3889 [Olpidium bornovanus]
MTEQEFIRNNRGIDNSASLPDEFLAEIYHEIRENEIKLKDEHEAAATAQIDKLDDLQLDSRTRREVYAQISEDIAQKTEALFRNMQKATAKGGRRAGNLFGRSNYTTASHFQHVRPMFEVAWMPILAGISSPLQESLDDVDMINRCLDGFKYAIRIISIFDLELERNAFVTTLAKFTFLNNLGEMKPKNVEAIKSLLEIAIVEGNYLKGSWKEVLTCVSQLERFQLISSGAGGQITDTSVTRTAKATTRNTTSSAAARLTNKGPPQLNLSEDAVAETASQKFVVLDAITNFVRCLSNVSWEEIKSSSHLDNPRTYSLQRLVEVAYYNMNRIRLEWSNIWAIIGDHLNMVGCHPNAQVGMYALDSLRQLSMKFLEKEELANYQFQKVFLKPFAYIMTNNEDPSIRDMVMFCLPEEALEFGCMIQARAQRLKSGWNAMFGVFTKAAEQKLEQIVVMAFDIVRSLSKDRFGDLVVNGTFPDFISCLVAFAKNTKFARTSLQAVELIRSTVPRMIEMAKAETGDSPQPEAKSAATDSLVGGGTVGEIPGLRFWYPIFSGYLEIVMTCADLEVRTR